MSSGKQTAGGNRSHTNRRRVNACFAVMRTGAGLALNRRCEAPTRSPRGSFNHARRADGCLGRPPVLWHVLSRPSPASLAAAPLARAAVSVARRRQAGECEMCCVSRPSPTRKRGCSNAQYRTPQSMSIPPCSPARVAGRSPRLSARRPRAPRGVSSSSRARGRLSSRASGRSIVSAHPPLRALGQPGRPE